MRASSILIYLLTAIFLFFSSIAEGANWEPISKSINEDQFIFIDTESIKHVSKNIVRVWVKLLFENPMPVYSRQEKKFLTYALDYEEHDCSEEKSRSLQNVGYCTDGTNESISGSAEWQYIIPGSNTSFVHNYLCNKEKPPPPLPKASIPESASTLEDKTKSSEVRLQENGWIKIVDQSVEKLTAEEFYKENISESEKGKIIRKLNVKIQFLRPCKTTSKIDEWLNKQGEKIYIDSLDEEGGFITSIVYGYFKALQAGDKQKATEIYQSIEKQYPTKDMYEYVRQEFRCDYRCKIFAILFSSKGEELSTMSNFISSYRSLEKTTVQTGETRSITFFIPETATSWHVWVPK